MDRGAVSDTRDDRRLRGWGRASGNAPGHRTRRIAVVLRFFLGSEGSQCRCAIGCERPLERLVGQMTDRTVRFRRIEMMVPNSAERRGGDQHRNEGKRGY